MQLTSLQELVLERYWKWHAEGMTFKKLSVLYSRRWLVLLGVIGMASMFVGEAPVPASIAVGFFAGHVLRDVHEIRNSLRIWPLLERIIDWKVAADVLAGQD